MLVESVAMSAEWRVEAAIIDTTILLLTPEIGIARFQVRWNRQSAKPSNRIVNIPDRHDIYK